jgi:uncharacterized protein
MFERWIKSNKNSYLLIGPRRAGKTTFLKHSHKQYRYLTLDDLDYLTLAKRDPKAVVDSQFMIIDEIQRVPELTIAVKYAIDELDATIAMSGSSRIGLLDSSADTLAGRISILSLPPACWGECDGEPTHEVFRDQADPIQLRHGNRKLEEMLKYGGFPEVLTQENHQDKEAVLKNYKDTYFTRDLSRLSNIENTSALYGILQHYGLSIGSLTQVSNFRQEVGLAHQTTQKYLNVLYQSDLGFKLLGYQYGPAKRQMKAAKSYFCDAGMITALGMRCSQGQVIENFVISELEKRRKIGFIDAEQLYYYQTIGGAEVDVVYETKGVKYAIEIKDSSKIQKSDVKNLKKFAEADPNNTLSFLFYSGETYQELDGVQCIPIASLYRGR